MGFTEPVINEGGTYTALFHNDPVEANGAAAVIEVKLTIGEGDWTGEALDALFQELVDVVSVSPKFRFASATKAQNTASYVTPTTPEDPDESL